LSSRAGSLAGGSLARSRRLVRRDELIGARADEIGAAHPLQRLAQQRPVVGIVIAQECQGRIIAVVAFPTSLLDG